MCAWISKLCTKLIAMKTYLLLLFLLCVGTAKGQEIEKGTVGSAKCIIDNGVIVINPYGKDEIRSYQFKRGESIKFCITHVNVFKVKGSKVEAVGKNFSFTSDIFTKMNEKEENGVAAMRPNIPDDFLILYNQFLENANSIALQVNLENDIRKRVIGDAPTIKDTDLIKREATGFYEKAHLNKKDIDALVIELRSIYSKMEIISKGSAQGVILTGIVKSKNDDKKKYDIELKEDIVRYKDEMLFVRKIMKTFDDPETTQEIIGKAKSGVVFYNLLQKEDFIYYTDGVQLNDDEVTLTPVLLSADDKELRKFNSITVKTSGNGVMVNFSTGYMLSFIGNQNFALKYNTSGDVTGVKELESNKLTHAIGGLAHVFWTRKDFSYGFSVGLSANTDAKISFYLGPSIAFLDKNRLVLTGGLSMVNVKRLDRNNLDPNDDFINPNIKEITYSDIYKVAGFFGVTYNLSKN